MSELKNYAEITFSNPIFIDILEKHIPNQVLAEYINTKGETKIKLPVMKDIKPPKNCEDFIGFIYNLFQENPDSSIGAAYKEKKYEILSDTVDYLSKLLDGFTSINITINITVPSEDNPEAIVNKKTEFSLNRTKTLN